MEKKNKPKKKTREELLSEIKWHEDEIANCKKQLTNLANTNDSIPPDDDPPSPPGGPGRP